MFFSAAAKSSKKRKKVVHSPRKVSARVMDCDESAVWKPRPLAGMIVDWQMKVFTVLAPSPLSL